MNTEQRVAVVTGAGRGIGREYALALARAGFAAALYHSIRLDSQMDVDIE